MKINDVIPGIYHHMEQLSIEVQKAQRQAELEQLSKYRSKRMAFYRDWVTPEKIAERDAAHKAAAESALERGRLMAAQAKLQMLTHEMTKHKFKMSPLTKPRMPWWKRFLAWLFSDA